MQYLIPKHKRLVSFLFKNLCLVMLTTFVAESMALTATYSYYFSTEYNYDF